MILKMKSIVTTPRKLGEVRSKSNPAVSYEIRLGGDGVVYCTCRGWITKKYCKHLEEYHARGISTDTQPVAMTKAALIKEDAILKIFKEQYKPVPSLSIFDDIIQKGIIEGKWK